MSPNDKEAILMVKSLRQAEEDALNAEGLLAPILLTKNKIPKLSFYKRKTLLETIAFFSKCCFQK